MTEDTGTDPLARLAALGANEGDADAANKSLLALLALGRLATAGEGSLPWSMAEAALADLIARFGGTTDTPGELGAARAFTGLAGDQVWMLDTELPGDGPRIHWLNEWNVHGRLAPGAEQALRASPELLRDTASRLVRGNFPESAHAELLDAVGLGDLVAMPRAPRRRQEPSGRWQGRFHAALDDYLRLTVSQAREQFGVLLGRTPAATGRKQGSFLPVETLLCLAASFRVTPNRYGGTNIEQVPEPVPALARLFLRSRASVLEKMRNLDNSRPNGAQWDALAGATLRERPTLFTHIYRVLLHAARAEGIGAARLPDFLELADGGELELLGQEELVAVDADELPGAGDLEVTDPETERIRAGAVRVSQHVFAQNVLRNCGERCVFCGLRPAGFGGRRMLLAGHIKPWRDSTPRERLDPANGLAACPSHDAAFDTGLLTIDEDLQITLARSLKAAVASDDLARQYFGNPPLLTVVSLPPQAKLPTPKYLVWHRTYIFADRRIPRRSGAASGASP